MSRDEWCMSTLDENKVICGRTYRYSSHAGNMYFNQLIINNLQVYSDASRWGKTVIISAVVDQVLQNPNGGFVRRDPLSGSLARYIAVDVHHARKMTSQAFRDTLNEKVSSGKKCKTDNRPSETQDSELVKTTASRTTSPQTVQSHKRKSADPTTALSHVGTTSACDLRTLLVSASERNTDCSSSSIQATNRSDPSLSAIFNLYHETNFLQNPDSIHASSSLALSYPQNQQQQQQQYQQPDMNVSASIEDAQNMIMSETFENYISPLFPYQTVVDQNNITECLYPNVDSIQQASNTFTLSPSTHIVSQAAAPSQDDISSTTLRDAIEKAYELTSRIQTNHESTKMHVAQECIGLPDILDNLEVLCDHDHPDETNSDPFEPNPIDKLWLKDDPNDPA